MGLLPCSPRNLSKQPKATEPPVGPSKRHVVLKSPIVLDDVRKDRSRVLATSAGASLLDLDDGVLCLEFHSKGNALDGDTLNVAELAFATIPGRYSGLLIANQGRHFSFGANLRWLLALLEDLNGDRARFHTAAKRFQRVTTGMRTAPFPSVAAPFELTIGGALEMSMYADRVQAHASLRASLPELAVGILPDLGGTSELYARCIDAAGEGSEALGLRVAFETIVFMRGSKNAQEARALQFLQEHDRITDDLAALVCNGKARVLELADGYAAPPHRRDIPVLGDAGYDALNNAVESAVAGGLATEYDAHVARAVARVMTGGPGPARRVSHEELLDLETAYFETLVFNEKTKARMEYMLEYGTPLRN
jgi:3-hydroxyacyl-CoA dehydrogenase